MAYLDDHPPAIRQFRERGTTPSGVIVVHTAESILDTVGPDTGAENVAAFIANRTTYGSYHRLVDSDSVVDVVRLTQQAYGDGTGSNPHAIHISAACAAADWSRMSPETRGAFVTNLARAATEAARWLQREYGAVVPARRISRDQSDRRLPGFISHGDRDPDRRTDPGAAFPWRLFLTIYAELMEDDDMAQYADQLDTIERKLDGLIARENRRDEKTRQRLRKLIDQGKATREDLELLTGLDDEAPADA